MSKNTLVLLVHCPASSKIVDELGYFVGYTFQHDYKIWVFSSMFDKVLKLTLAATHLGWTNDPTESNDKFMEELAELRDKYYPQKLTPINSQLLDFCANHSTGTDNDDRRAIAIVNCITERDVQYYSEELPKIFTKNEHINGSKCAIGAILISDSVQSSGQIPDGYDIVSCETQFIDKSLDDVRTFIRRKFSE